MGKTHISALQVNWADMTPSVEVVHLSMLCPCVALLLLSAGFRRAGGGYEALRGGPEVGASLLLTEQPGQDRALSSVLGADRRPG